MAQDPHPDDERPGSDPPLPPEDRLWRHPSELGAGVSPPAAWFGAAPEAAARRPLAVGALAGACLAGAVVAVGAMWLAGPTRSTSERSSTTIAGATRTTAVASFAPSRIPTEELAGSLGPSLPTVEVEHDGTWTAGTGVWLDDRGALLTAAPLLAGAGQVVVTGRDGVRRTATVAGTDDATGIASLTVDRTSGTPITASTTAPRAGEPIALAAAPGVLAGGRSADASLVTAVVRITSVRTTVGGLVLHDAIQLDRKVPTDAVGGVLVDEGGRLVGIALGDGDDAQLGTAIPGPEALAAARDLLDDGEVSRAWLGVRATDLTPDRATLLQLPGGAHLTSVTADSPAAAAGLRVGDVVTAVDGEVIDDASDLVVTLRSLAPGHVASVTVTRDGREVEVPVTLG